MQHAVVVHNTSMSSSGPRKLTSENLQISEWICLSLTAKSPEVILSGDHCSFTTATADSSQKTDPLEISWAVLNSSQPLFWAVLHEGLHKESDYVKGGWN